MKIDIILHKFLAGAEFVKDIMQKYTVSSYGRHVYREEEYFQFVLFWSEIVF
jgi:hypothetical protein